MREQRSPKYANDRNLVFYYVFRVGAGNGETVFLILVNDSFQADLREFIAGKDQSKQSTGDELNLKREVVLA